MQEGDLQAQLEAALLEAEQQLAEKEKERQALVVAAQEAAARHQEQLEQLKVGQPSQRTLFHK